MRTERKSRVLGFQIQVLEKNPGAGISNPNTAKKSRYWKKNSGTGNKILGTGISNSSTGNRIEIPYNRENFPGASRTSKTLTGVLWDLQN
jgi:hypothetical protein